MKLILLPPEPSTLPLAWQTLPLILPGAAEPLPLLCRVPLDFAKAYRAKRELLKAQAIAPATPQTPKVKAVAAAPKAPKTPVTPKTPGEKRDIKNPGVHGGKYYRTKEGDVRYGDRPEPEAPEGPEELNVKIHPGGKDEPGIAARIRESQTHQGTYHVIGAEGGSKKLNMLRVTPVKEGEKYQEQAKDRAKAAKQRRKAREDARREALSEDERAAEKEAKKATKEAKKAEKGEMEAQQHKARESAYNRFADVLGWDKDAFSFDKQTAGLAEKGYKAKEIARLEKAHYRQIDSKIEAAKKMISNEILKDFQMREAVGLDRLPLKGDGETIGYEDLVPTSLAERMSPQAALRAKAEKAIAADLLADETEDLKAKLQDEGLSDEERGQVQAQVEAAELMREGLQRDPLEIQADIDRVDQELREALDAKQSAMEAHQAALAANKDGEVPPELQAKLDETDKAIQAKVDEKRKLDLQIHPHEAVVEGEASDVKERRLRRMDPAKREALERMRESMRKAREKMKAAKAAGHVQDPLLETKPQPKMDPHQAMLALKEAIRYDQVKKEVAKASKQIDMGKAEKAYVVQVEDLDEAAAKHLEETIDADLARSFIGTVETAGGVMDSPEEARDIIHGHLAQGNWNALHDASHAMFHDAIMTREAADVLGVAGAAQVMAYHLHQAFGRKQAKAMGEAIGEHHQATQDAHMKEAMAKAAELRAKAKELELESIDNPLDLAHVQALHKQRMSYLKEAARVTGQAMGELEAHAALHASLLGAPKRKVEVSLGGVSSEAAVRTARGLGLEAGDYEIHSDGTNHYLTIKDGGFGKLVKPYDPKELKAQQAVRRIKDGHEDEQGWLPPGFARREVTPSFHGDPPEQGLSLADAHKAGGGDWEKTLRHFIGSHWHDGWSADRIHQELNNHRNNSMVKGMGPKEVDAFLAARDKLLPVMEYEDPDAHSKLAVYAEWDKQRGQIQSQIFQGKLTNDDMKAWEKDNPNPGKPKSTTRHAESYKAEMEPMANEWVKEHLGQEVAGIHGQRLQEGDKTREALHRALAGFPEGKHAFAKPGEVDAEGAKAIRTFFEERIGGKAKVGAREAHDKEMQAWLDKNKAPEMYAKPEASLFSMFDEPPDPNAAPQISQEYKAWVGKRSQMGEMLREKHFGKQNITWPEYVAMMRGTDRARKAVQDRMKHELLTAFKGHYQDQHQAALMSSRDKIHASDRHLVALDPDAHKELRAQESKIDAGLHARDEFGKFIEDEIIARRIKKQAAARAEKDQTADPFGGTMDAEAEAKAQKEILPTERLTLGRQAEGQIAGMLQQMGHAYSPGKPLDVFPFRMHSTPEDLAPGGTPYHLQQRGIKFGVLRKRCGIHADVGSGKTNMAFGIFTSGHAKGEIKRAIFAVPSVVKGQFGQEAATYLEPGKYKVHADVKGDATGRFKAYRDSGTHMMVVTHQGFRDDAVKMLANHWRISPQQAAEQCMGTEPKELSGHLRAAFKEAGAEDLLDGFFMDEGHHSLNREGKQDSLFARIVDSISHHAEEKDKYFVNFTGTPVKNDMSEIHDELRKVAPSKYGDRGEFMRRFHGLTRANAAALQKEMDQHFYSFRIPAGTEPNRVVYGETPGKPALALTTEQKANVKAIEGHYEAATRAARQGSVDREALEALTGKTGMKDAELKRYNKALAGIRDSKIRDAIDAAPAEHNVKIQEALKLSEKFKGEGRGGAIFVRSNKARAELQKALEAKGHKVLTIDGSDDSAHKDEKRRAYLAGHYDIVLLSDACNAGVSLHKSKKHGQGSWMIMYDTPHTFMAQHQRQARINRIGQKYKNVDLIELSTDHKLEKDARARLNSKRERHEIVTSDSGRLSPLADKINAARMESSEADTVGGGGVAMAA